MFLGDLLRIVLDLVIDRQLIYYELIYIYADHKLVINCAINERR